MIMKLRQRQGFVQIIYNRVKLRIYLEIRKFENAVNGDRTRRQKNINRLPATDQEQMTIDWGLGTGDWRLETADFLTVHQPAPGVPEIILGKDRIDAVVEGNEESCFFSDTGIFICDRPEAASTGKEILGEYVDVLLQGGLRILVQESLVEKARIEGQRSLAIQDGVYSPFTVKESGRVVLLPLLFIKERYARTHQDTGEFMVKNTLEEVIGGGMA